MNMRLLCLMMPVLACVAATAQNTAVLSTQAPPALPAVPAAPPAPALSMPAFALQQGAPGQVAPGGQPDTVPNMEITAVEVVGNGVAALSDERLRPFTGLLNKLVPGGSFQIVSQETKPTPFSEETQWTVTDRYEAFILPMEQTKEGAVRLDARVSQHDGDKTLNALRAEGEVPSGKVMAFRGLQGPNGGELLLLLRQKSEGGDQQSQGESDEQQEQDSEQHAGDQNNKDKQPQEQQDQQEAQAEKQDAQGEKSDEENKAEQEEAQSDTPKDAQNLEALLRSLEEEDQRQQADARFDRRKISLPPSGEWW